MGEHLTPEAYAEKCASDPLWFIEANLRIAPKDGGLVQFRLNDEQMGLLRAIVQDIIAGRPVRYIILKARQLGFSTLVEAVLYWLASTRSHTNCLVMSHSLDSAHHILQMTHRFSNYDGRLEEGVMPEKGKSNRSELVFDNPDWKNRGNEPGLDSRILVATADNRSAGHSFTLQGFHGSEVARWPSAELITGVMAALPDKPGTMAFLESTANGRGNFFYETWRDAERGRNEWKPWFVSWTGHREYAVKLSPKEMDAFANLMTDDEFKMQRRHGLTFGQLAWRRKKIQAFEGMGRPAEDVFREQYPLDAEEAFISTGHQYFDMRAVVKAEVVARERKYVEGWIEVEGPYTKFRPAGVKWHERKALAVREACVRVWRMPEEGEDYVIGADVALGVSSGGDQSVAYVLKRRTLEFVARVAGHMEPDDFADRLLELAWFYNEAFLCPENNSIGMAVARKTSRKYVRHAYHIDVSSGVPKYDLDRPGWTTHQGNRREMYGYLRQCVKDGVVMIWDEDFWTETNDFIVPEDRQGRMQESKPRAAQHKHDDHVAAAAITLQANDPWLAGVIRKVPVVTGTPRTYLEMLRAEDLKATERGTKDRRYDEHVGRID